MKQSSKRAILLLALGLSVGPPALLAQKPAPQQQVTVVVVNVLPQPPQPVKSVSASVMFQDVTAARGVTNSQGQALLVVSTNTAMQSDLRIDIKGAGDLVIFQPPEGQLPALATTIKVSLLPRGSPDLKGPAQIQGLLTRLSKQAGSHQQQIAELAKENAGLKAQLAAAQAGAQAQQQDVAAQIDAWAVARGFTPEEVNASVKQWAVNNKDTQTALSAFALKNYAEAARSFQSAADSARQARAKLMQVRLEQNRDLLRSELQSSEQSAKSFQLEAQYHAATQTLEQARDDAALAHQETSTDEVVESIWLQAISDAANARRLEGEVAPAAQSLTLLAQAAGDFDSLAHEYALLGDDQSAAAAQTNLAHALTDEGERASGEMATALFDKAVQACRNALEVRTKANLPEDWATTQDDLGIALMDEGDRATGDRAMALLDQAVQAFQSVLEVTTKADHPQAWAEVQCNLGDALKRKGERTPGDKAMALLEQSVEAYKSALQVRTRSDLPQDWAATQAVLGDVLEREAERSGDEKALVLFDEAVHAFQNALEVYTRADLLQQRAKIQNDLGAALMVESERTSRDKAKALLAQAAQAFQSSLEVFTKADLPQYWATVQMNRGDALAMEGLATSGEKAIPLFDQAFEAYNEALSVYTKADLPEYWAETQMSVMELSFVAGRYSACIQRIPTLADDSISPALTVVRDTIAFACQWGTGDRIAAQHTQEVLLLKAAKLQAATWDFSASLQILSTSPDFAAERSSWIALFTAVQNGDSAGMTAALHRLEPLFQQ